VLQGALAGALTAGLTGQATDLGKAAGSIGPVGTIALNTTVQGGIQALLGGSFKDGAIAGFASGLAAVAGASIGGGIDKAVKEGTMSAAEAFAARTLVRVFTSAVKALGNPDDPNHGFASALVNEVVGQAMGPAPAAGATPPATTPTVPAPAPAPAAEAPPADEAAPPATAPAPDEPVPAPTAETPPADAAAPVTVTPAAFDDEGNLMPGVVDPNASPADQAAQLMLRLQQQGFGESEALGLATDYLQDRLATSPQPLQPPSAESRNWTPDELQARIDDVEQQLRRELEARQARDDSLLSADDLLTATGGPGGGSSAVRPVINRGFEAAMNAGADAFGIAAPLLELQGDLAKLQSVQAEGRLDSIRQAMRNAGMTNVPEGYVPAWDANGNLVRDYQATAENLSKAYGTFATDQRLRANWGDNYQSIRIGRSQMTASEFEVRALNIQQQAANDAYDRGVRAIATGELPVRISYEVTLGSYVDEQARRELRAFGAAEGITDSNASNTFAVNRYIRGNGMIGIPDLRIGAGLLSDVTLSGKDGYTSQLRSWNVIIPNDTVIIRPDQLGGSYVVPRYTIRPVVIPGKGGK
jgi:hypothetical protein